MYNILYFRVHNAGMSDMAKKTSSGTALPIVRATTSRRMQDDIRKQSK